MIESRSPPVDDWTVANQRYLAAALAGDPARPGEAHG